IESREMQREPFLSSGIRKARAYATKSGPRRSRYSLRCVKNERGPLIWDSLPRCFHEEDVRSRTGRCRSSGVLVPILTARSKIRYQGKSSQEKWKKRLSHWTTHSMPSRRAACALPMGLCLRLESEERSSPSSRAVLGESVMISP